jgi:hypothetical protein
MRPFGIDEDFKPKRVELDYSRLLVDPEVPWKGEPDPFIKRYNGKTYYDPWMGIDYTPNGWLKNNRAIERAIWAYATSSQTVPTILPTFLDPAFTYVVPTDAPLYAALPRKASLGAMESYTRITALGSPSGTGYWKTETESVDPVAPTPARVNAQKVIAETWGGVTGFQRAAAEGFKDMLEEAHRERLAGLLTDGLEDGCLNGVGTTIYNNGLLTAQGTTNHVAMTSTAVTLAAIQDCIRQAWVAGGDLESYGFAVTDPTTFDYVKNLISEYLGYVNVENYDLPWGLKTFSIQGIPFLKSRKMPTGANVKKILMLDRRVVYNAILTDVTTELYGKIKDEQNFAIKWYGRTINRAPEFCAVVDTIA